MYVMHNIMVPMKDRVRLATDVYLPQRAGRYPVVLTRTPYGKRGIGQWAIDRFVSAGYAFCVQDTRGRYNSEGDFYPFAAEEADGRETVAWVKSQTWCNGRIGAYGVSYHGYTQYALAVDNDDICAIAPIFSSPSIYDVLYRGGCFCQAFLQWALVNHGDKVRDAEPFDLAGVCRRMPAIEAADAAIGTRIGFYRDWHSHSPQDAYWNRLAPQRGVERLSAPAFLIAGWYDLFAVSQLTDFERLQRHPDDAVRRGSKLLIGPWSHVYYGPHHEACGIAAAMTDGRPDIVMEELFQWLAYSLQGVANRWERRAPVRLYVMGENVWRDEAEWPLARAVYTRYYLRSGGNANSSRGDGGLTLASPDPHESPDGYVYDPLDPVPTAGGSHINSGPAEQGEVEGRQDVLVYTSAPLARPLEITGPIRLALYAASDAPDTDFTGKLTDVFPDGRSVVVSDGILRARYRAGLDRPRLLSAGEIGKFEIEMSPASVLFGAGHRIRLQVSSSNFPCYAVNPNTGTDIAHATETRKARQTVYHDSRHASFVALPVIPRGEALE